MVAVEVSEVAPVASSPAVESVEDPRDEGIGGSTRAWWSPPVVEVAQYMSDEQVLALFGVTP